MLVFFHKDIKKTIDAENITYPASRNTIFSYLHLSLSKVAKNNLYPCRSACYAEGTFIFSAIVKIAMITAISLKSKYSQ